MTDVLKPKSSSEQLLELAQGQAKLFLASDDTTWAAIETGEQREVRSITSPLFRQWLTHQFYAVTGAAPNPRALETVLLTLETKARFDGLQDEVFLRTGTKGEALYLDLTDDRWRAARITAEGWQIQDRPDVYFQRRRGMLPLPEPTRGGEICQLRPFLNLSSDDDFLLILAWLLAALRPTGPYPILALAGEPGASKSTTARLLRSLVDPNAAPLRASPRDERDCWIAASNAAVLTLDNLSSCPRSRNGYRTQRPARAPMPSLDRRWPPIAAISPMLLRAFSTMTRYAWRCWRPAKAIGAASRRRC
jgi:hypothetical protein